MFYTQFIQSFRRLNIFQRPLTNKSRKKKDSFKQKYACHNNSYKETTLDTRSSRYSVAFVTLSNENHAETISTLSKIYDIFINEAYNIQR